MKKSSSAVLLAESGTIYRIAVILPGDKYGRDNRMTATQRLVEFQSPDGGFIQRYMVGTVLDNAELGRGLCLDGKRTDRDLTAKDMLRVSGIVVAGLQR